MNLNKKSLLSYILLPVSVVYYLLTSFRRLLYRFNFLTIYNFDIPVIVVGNITVGGSGKTPIVIALVEHFKGRGLNIGVVSRGFGGKHGVGSLYVNQESNASESGDEPLLIATQTNVPVVINTNRVQAVKDLIKDFDVELVISDDGLQHYSMGRKIEIAVVDGKWRFGNGFFLPSGPLREPLSRLNSVDFVVNNGAMHPGEIYSSLVPKFFVNVLTLEKKPLDFFHNQTCHAVAGIGHPDRFFDTLVDLNINVLPHPFKDHYYYSESDFLFSSNHPIIMTTKDCVKCREFANDNMWYLLTEVDISEDFLNKLQEKL